MKFIRLGVLSFLVVSLVAVGSTCSPPPETDAPKTPDADRLVRQLGDRHGAEQEAASNALLQIGRPALKALRKGTNSDNPEVRRRSRVLLELIDADAIALRELGALVNVDMTRPDEPVTAVYLGGSKVEDETDLPRVEAFDSLEKLSVDLRRVTPVAAERLARLKRTTELSLGIRQAPDGSLAPLEKVDALHSLVLNNVKLTDDAMRQVGALTQLRELTLDHAEFPEGSLERLKGLTKLYTLMLRSTKTSDADLEYLKNMHDLAWLDLTDTRVTDAGLPALSGLAELRDLMLDGTQVTDAGLPALGGLSHLRTLQLMRTKITDGGLPSLAGLRELRLLTTDGTKVTESGRKRLAESIPSLRY